MELWKKILQRLEPTIEKRNFITWFQNTGIIKKEEGTIHVGVPTTFARDWLTEKYNLKILQAAQEMNPEINEIIYEVHSSLSDPEDTRAVDMRKIFKNTIKTVRKISKKAEIKVGSTGLSSKILNPKYRLENYISGNENRLPHAVAEAVAQNPGSLYNPLFIYGEVGLGKTHLLQGIGNHILHHDPDKVVVYMTSEKFINEIVTAIGKKNTKAFKDRYRKVDCLIIDDIQFLANKSTTQEEFFHTFNELYDNNKQIIISSDRAPSELNGIEDRLKSRFAMGMIVDVVLPEYETRLAILQNKCQEHQTIVAPELLEFLAYNVDNSIRELEGILLQVIARAKVERTTPTVRMIAEHLKKLNNDRNLIGYECTDTAQIEKALSTERIISIVADYYHLTKSDIVGSVRRKEVMVPRQICMYLIRQELEKSFENIGEEFGGRSHTTVMHAFSKITNRLKEDKRLVSDLHSIKQSMGL